MMKQIYKIKAGEQVSRLEILNEERESLLQMVYPRSDFLKGMEKFSVLERKFFPEEFAGESGAEAPKSEFSVRIFFEKSSNFVQKTPPVRKCLCRLALCEGSPADFKRKLEFFIFAPKGPGQRRASFIFIITGF